MRKKLFYTLILGFLVVVPIYLLLNIYFHLKEEDELKLGYKVPKFSLSMLDGSRISSEDFYGSYYLLVFFSTDCVECAGQINVINEMFSEMQDHGLKILLVSKDNRRNTKRFLNENNVSLNVAIDEKGIFKKIFKSVRVPSLFLINYEGGLIYIKRGFTNRKELRHIMSGLS